MVLLKNSNKMKKNIPKEKTQRAKQATTHLQRLLSSLN